MTGVRGANSRLVGQLLALSGLFMLAASLAAWMRWLPYAEGTVRALAKVFLVTGGADLIIAFVLMARYRR
ncbi:MAG: hypothetical protein ABIQ52_02515 [Vicinamibacterales bacterium]